VGDDLLVEMEADAVVADRFGAPTR